MIALLRDNQLLLLFVVVAIGYPLGRVRLAGSTIGVAAVLFAGLAVGALDDELRLPEIVYQLGLVIFVYTVGLSSGPGFVAAFRRRGLQYTAWAGGLLLGAAGLTWLARVALGLEATHAAGLFAGSLTNTPALAGILEYLRDHDAGAAALSEPVVAYSVAYPMGVVGVILAMAVVRRAWRIDYMREAARARDVAAGQRSLENRTVRITSPEAIGRTVRELDQRHRWGVTFGRIQRDGKRHLVTEQTAFQSGDLVSVIGASEDVARAVSFLGEESGEELHLDRKALDYRRIFVSNPAVAGHRLRDLNLPQQYGALVTRVRRGDVELAPHGDTVLELGDRVRVVTARDNMPAVSHFFGDSLRSLSEIDILTFSLGLAAGLLVGVAPIPLPGGLTLKLGQAGGPLVVALLLGALGRTGPLVWGLPYNANLTLRQMGLVLFLAGVGTNAGRAFVTTMSDREGLLIFGAGAAVTMLTALAALWAGYRLLRVPMNVLLGMVAALHTQPAVLGFALEETEDDLPNIGYAAIYPIATIAKIATAQVLIALWT